MSCEYALSVQHSQQLYHRNGHKLMISEHDMARLICVEYFQFLSFRSCPMRLDVWAQSATEKLCKGFNAKVLFLNVDLTLLLSCGYYILCIRNPDHKYILAPFAFCSPPQKIFDAISQSIIGFTKLFIERVLRYINGFRIKHIHCRWYSFKTRKSIVLIKYCRLQIYSSSVFYFASRLIKWRFTATILNSRFYYFINNFLLYLISWSEYITHDWCHIESFRILISIDFF